MPTVVYTQILNGLGAKQFVDLLESLSFASLLVALIYFSLDENINKEICFGELR